MKRHNLAFIDLETTGLDPGRHEILEIGCIVAKQVPCERGAAVEKIDEFELKVKPRNLENAEREALRISGYNEAEWVFALDIRQALRALAEKTAGCVMVAHNVAFDWAFLERAFTIEGIAHNFHYHKLDTISLAFAKLYRRGEIQKFSLQALCGYFGVKNERPHTALSDIRATFEVYKKLIEL